MMDLCQQIVDELGGLPQWRTPDEMRTPYYRLFRRLSDRLRAHYRLFGPNSLSELERPVGEWHALWEVMEESGIAQNSFQQNPRYGNEADSEMSETDAEDNNGYGWDDDDHASLDSNVSVIN